MTNAHAWRVDLKRWAGRLHQIRTAGIVDPVWIADQIERETLAALKRTGARQKPAGLWKRITGFLSSLPGRRRTPEAQARRYADAVKALMRDESIKNEQEFERHVDAMTTTLGHYIGLMKAMQHSWLHALDLPIDALKPSSFQTMLTASFYRFAYGPRQAVDFFNARRAVDSNGVYVTYHRHHGSGLIEKRILAYCLIESGFGSDSFIRVVELSRQNGALIVRSGVVVPNQGHEAFILSGHVDLEECRAWLQSWAGADGDHLFEIEDCMAPQLETNTQSHRMGFLTLRTRNPGEIVGAFLDGELNGQLIGSRLAQGALNSDLIMTVRRLSQDELRSLPADDRNLVASMPRYSDETESLVIPGEGPGQKQTAQTVARAATPMDVPSGQAMMSAPEPSKS